MSELQATAARGDEATLQRELNEFAYEMYADPVGYALGAYRWPINGEPGPDRWQGEVLQDIGRQVLERGFDGLKAVLPIRKAISSGHGAGKSALFAWLVDWIMSTRPHCQGSVTANTSDQLEFKTWAAIQRWTALSSFAGWFTINSTIMFRKGHRASWFCVPLANDEKKSDAFQGQHAKDSTSFYLIDEGSGLGSKIPEAIEGGLTDGEPMVFTAGNMLRNRGWFYECVYGRAAHLWRPVVIDTRTSRLANQDLIQQWLDLYGEDSDFFRVRVRGLPPKASELQFIDKERVDLARARTQPHLPQDALIAGFDVSGGGDAWNVIRFRRGLNGRVKDPIRLEGSKDKSRAQRVGICAELLRDRRPEHQLAALFVDAAFGAPIVATLESMGFRNVYAVNFGDESPDPLCGNRRAFMYKESKEWLLYGSLPDEDLLADQACLAGFHITKAGRLMIESKDDLRKRGERSPDDWDAFALTFAAPVANRAEQAVRGHGLSMPSGSGGWMGM